MWMSVTGGIAAHMASGTIRRCTLDNAIIDCSSVSNSSMAQGGVRYNSSMMALVGSIVGNLYDEYGNEASKVIENCTANQARIYVRVYQGNSEAISENEKYGEAGGIVGTLYTFDDSSRPAVRHNTSNAIILGDAANKGGIIGEIADDAFIIENNQYSGADFGSGRHLQ